MESKWRTHPCPSASFRAVTVSLSRSNSLTKFQTQSTRWASRSWRSFHHCPSCNAITSVSTDLKICIFIEVLFCAIWESMQRLSPTLCSMKRVLVILLYSRLWWPWTLNCRSTLAWRRRSQHTISWFATYCSEIINKRSNYYNLWVKPRISKKLSQKSPCLQREKLLNCFCLKNVCFLAQNKSRGFIYRMGCHNSGQPTWFLRWTSRFCSLNSHWNKLMHPCQKRPGKLDAPTVRFNTLRKPVKRPLRSFSQQLWKKSKNFLWKLGSNEWTSNVKLRAALCQIRAWCRNNKNVSIKSARLRFLSRLDKNLRLSSHSIFQEGSSRTPSLRWDSHLVATTIKY